MLRESSVTQLELLQLLVVRQRKDLHRLVLRGACPRLVALGTVGDCHDAPAAQHRLE